MAGGCGLCKGVESGGQRKHPSNKKGKQRAPDERQPDDRIRGNIKRKGKYNAGMQDASA